MIDVNKLLQICANRGVANANSFSDFLVIRDDSGDRIATWDVKKLGPVPTQAEIDAVDATVAATSMRTRRRDQNLWTPQMVALVKALNTRLRAANVDNVTVGTFRAAIEAEYDLLVS